MKTKRAMDVGRYYLLTNSTTPCKYPSDPIISDKVYLWWNQT